MKVGTEEYGAKLVERLNCLSSVVEPCCGYLTAAQKWPARPVEYYTLTECGHEIAVSADPVSSSGYSILFQEADNVLVTPLGLQVFIGSGDRLLSDHSPARLPLDYTIKK
ncbi:hypothetical protein EVAR_16006_1 [Eumeta japonica]|uniref:Uncharacterized protein n=1 Tax=Eumeta variegata TaxID=151549 RepID=A0A4C1ZKT0_EUMVA|nr:hypothetical protein EVAR_16006_1 [Eumeta japonica]